MSGFLAALLFTVTALAAGFWFRVGWTLAGSLLKDYLVDSQIQVNNHAHGGDITVIGGKGVTRG